LESKAFDVRAGAWINGTVPLDSTVGNDTFFVITWMVKKPEIILQDPKGKKYTTSDFQDDKLNIRSARLQIPGTAEVSLFFSPCFINPYLCCKNKIMTCYIISIKINERIVFTKN
jgi:hypothetical protein